MEELTLEVIISNHAVDSSEHYGGSIEDYKAQAMRVLAAHDAEVAATALEEAASAVYTNGVVSWMLTGGAKKGLHDRAAAIRDAVKETNR